MNKVLTPNDFPGTGTLSHALPAFVHRYNLTARPFNWKFTADDFSWPRFRGIGQVLAHVSTYEHQHGRPMLSALVVRKQTRQAGDGFAVLGRDLGERIQPVEEKAFWRRQVEEAVRYWSSQGAGEDGQDAAAAMARALSLLARAVADIEEASRLLSAV